MPEKDALTAQNDGLTHTKTIPHKLPQLIEKYRNVITLEKIMLGKS